jgi:hypothetical protein
MDKGRDEDEPTAGSDRRNMYCVRHVKLPYPHQKNQTPEKLLQHIRVVSLPLLGFSSLVLINSINPMLQMFLFEFDLTNASDETLWITPVGAVGKQGYRHVLPQFMLRFPAFARFKEGDHRLAAGETRRIIYDWDDINFSEIAVRNERGDWRQLVTDSNPTAGQYRPPAEDAYVIESFAALDPIHDRVLEAAVAERYCFRLLLLLLAGLVPISMFVLAVILGRPGPRRRDLFYATGAQPLVAQANGCVAARRVSVGRIICAVLAAILIAVTVFYAREWYKWGRELHECADARPASLAVDLSKPGRFTTPLNQFSTLPDAEGFYLSLGPTPGSAPGSDPTTPGSAPTIPGSPPQSESIEELFEGLEGTITIVDQEGTEVLATSILPICPSEKVTEEPILIAFFIPFAKGSYIATIDITSGAPALAGVEQTLYAAYDIVGFEFIPGMIAVFYTIVCGIPAVILSVMAITRFARHGIWKSC